MTSKAGPPCSYNDLKLLTQQPIKLNQKTIPGKQTPQIKMSNWFLFGSECVDAFTAYSEGVGFWSGDVWVYCCFVQPTCQEKPNIS